MHKIFECTAPGFVFYCCKKQNDNQSQIFIAGKPCMAFELAKNNRKQ